MARLQMENPWIDDKALTWPICMFQSLKDKSIKRMHIMHITYAIKTKA